MILFALTAFCFMALGHFYALWRLFPRMNRWYVALIAAVLPLGFLALRIFEVLYSPTLVRAFYVGLGFVSMAVPWFLTIDIFLLALRFAKRRITYCAHLPATLPSTLRRVGIATLFIAWGYASVQFHMPITVERHTVESTEVSRPYRLLHITDTQYGSISDRGLARIAEVANHILANEAIDAIAFTGDMVDGDMFSREALAPLAFGAFDGPKFFSIGNHEYYHDYSHIMRILPALGYEVLSQRTVKLNELNIIGVDDPRPGDMGIDQLSERLDPTFIDPARFNVLLYHRPSEVDVAATRGIDLMLAGHTHGGQFFPYTLVVRWLFPYPQGWMSVSRNATNLLEDITARDTPMHLYTSDGAGLWGPPLRLGSRNMLAVITIAPKTTE